VDDVIAAEAVEGQPVEGRVLVEDGDLGREPDDAQPAGVAGDGEVVGGRGGVDGHRIDLAVGAPRRRPQGQLDPAQVRAGQVVDDDAVGPAQGAQLEAFDAVEVHHDAADVAREPGAGSVGRD